MDDDNTQQPARSSINSFATHYKNITAILAFVAQPVVNKQAENKQAENKVHNYKVNFTQALSTMRDTIVILLSNTVESIDYIINDILGSFTKAIEPVRPGRKFPRNHKRAQRKNCLTYKQIL